MAGVIGEIFRKKISKDADLVLSYDWESYEYGKHSKKKVKYSGTLPGEGETVFVIGKEKSSDDDYSPKFYKLWIYHGGSDLDFSLKKNIPKEVLNAWNKEIRKTEK
jgi:hypothetical protein